MKKVDLGLFAAIAMLVIWVMITFIVNDAPGITHALLTGGLSLLIWRIVKRSEPKAPAKPPQP